ncbi:MAG: hypothetical protein J0L93_10945 [Deltaproteobacteria bacterium]|nr:hypothetical protein [Deltaproteobacteria bacterium]
MILRIALYFSFLALLLAGQSFLSATYAEDLQCNDPSKIDQTKNELQDILKNASDKKDSKFEIKNISNSVSSMVTQDGGKKKAFTITPDGKLIRLIEGSDQVEVRQLPKEFIEHMGTTEFSSDKTLQLDISPETELAKELQDLLTFAQDGETAHLDLDKVFESADPFRSSSPSVAEAAPANIKSAERTNEVENSHALNSFLNSNQIAELEREVLRDLNTAPKADKPLCSKVPAAHQAADILSGACINDLSNVQLAQNIFEGMKDLFTTGFGSMTGSLNSFTKSLTSSENINIDSSSELASSVDSNSNITSPSNESSTAVTEQAGDSSAKGDLGAPESFDPRLSMTMTSLAEQSALNGGAESDKGFGVLNEDFLAPTIVTQNSDEMIMGLADSLLSQMSENDVNAGLQASSFISASSVSQKLKALKISSAVSSAEVLKFLESAKKSVRSKAGWKLLEDGTLVPVKNWVSQKLNSSKSKKSSKADKVFEYPKDLAILRTRRKKQS